MLLNTATNFLYDNEKLSDYEMVLCKFDSSTMETVSVGNNLTFNTVKTSLSNKNYLVNAAYEEPLTTTFQICKNDCRSETKYITPEELTSLLRWLARRDGYHKFEIYQKGFEGIFFRGSFNNIQQLKVGGRMCGLELTFVTDSPYGYEDICLDFTTTAHVGYSIFSMSNETGHLYPTVFTCKCLQSGNLQIHNSIEDRITEIKNCVKDEIISIDGNHKVIESTVSSHKLYNDFNYNYFRLGSKYEDNLNIITTSLPCQIHMEYESIRKIGIG